MKTLRWVLIIVIVILAPAIIIGFTLPARNIVTSETIIALSPERVFYSVATFSDRHIWDPWFETDTSAVSEYVLKEGYSGSKFLWDSELIGNGEMRIDSVNFGTYILSSVKFGDRDPAFPVEWTFKNELGITRVTWSFSMSSPSPMGRIVNYFMGRSIKSSYDTGLANLKHHLERQGVVLSSISDPAIAIIPSMEALTASSSVRMDSISLMLEYLYDLIMNEATAQSLQVTGMPFAIYSDYGESPERITLTAGIPVTGKWHSGDYVKGKTFKEFMAVEAYHTGPYDEFSLSYEKIEQFIAKNKIPVKDESWEFYQTDPGMESDVTKWVTAILFPLK